MKNPGAIAGFVLFGNTLLLGSAVGAEELIQGYARVDERVIDTETSIESLPTPIPFRTFRYPHVNVLNDATFIADDNSYYVTLHAKTNLLGYHNGIYRCAGKDGEVIPLAVKGQATPGPSNTIFRSFLALQTHENNFCFAGWLDQVKDGVTNNTLNGIYASFGSGPLICIVNDEEPTKGLSPTLRLNPFYGSIYLDTVLYTAYESNYGSEFKYYLFMYDHRTGKSRQILVSGDHLLNSQGVLSRISYFNQTQWIYDDLFTVVANIVPQDMSIHLVDLNGDHEDPARNAILVADTWMSPPETASSRFINFYSAPIDRDRVAFVADFLTNPGSVTNQGVYFWQDGETSSVADTTDTVPGYDFSFTSFDRWISLDKGKLIFRGFGKDGYEGLFLYDPDLKALFLLIDNNQELDGKRITGFEIGSNSVVGERMIFMAKFKDDSMAIYMAMTPAWRAPRLDMPIPGSE